MPPDRPESDSPATRRRREPPPFRLAAVARVERLTPRLCRVTLAGQALRGLRIEEPASSVRLLLPEPDGELVMPTWNDNEFLRPDGRRPAIRTFTPLRCDPEAGRLDLEIVVHGDGVASRWAEGVEEGGAAAVSGPARGYTIDRQAPSYLLAGDETAIPAISQLLENLPGDTDVHVRVEVAERDARVELTEHPGAEVEWLEAAAGAPPGDALVRAVVSSEWPADAKLWVAGEAAAVQRIRRHLFQDRGLPRTQASVRGYWKHGRAAGGDD